jgi:GTPase SAR1 family protein
MWQHYYNDVDAIIFIIDSADQDRINEASHELRKIMTEEKLQNVPFLIMGNKQDIKDSMDENTLEEKLNIRKLKLKYKIQLCSAQKGFGIYEGIDWMIEQFSGK